jgi:ubiquinone/menaquinone biosynthesis C-methylase UbiE
MSEVEQWQLTGNAPEIYQSDHVPALFAVWAPILVDLARPMPGERVLDLACGTGVVTRAAAQRVGPSGRVLGIDLNPEMLAVARRVSEQGTNDAPIEWLEASADALPLQDETCDVAYCQAGLMFFPDRPRALAEVRRVLVSGGRTAMLVWQSSPAHFAFADALARHVSGAAEAMVRAPYALANAAEFETLLQSTAFRDVTVSTQTNIACYASPKHFVQSMTAGSPLAGHIAQVDEATRAALLEDVKITLRTYVDNDRLSFPMGAHLVSARK